MTTEAQLQAIAEFDHVFTVNPDGSLSDTPGIYAPEVYHSNADDIEICGEGWEALTGYTGQYGYHGAIMHASEFIGGGLARDILSEPGTYVAVVVNVRSYDHDEEPAGWAILRKI